MIKLPFFTPVIFVLAASAALAEDAPADKIVCLSADGAVIYTSKTNDIAAFEASRSDLSVAHAQEIPGRNATIYYFEPGNVRCVVRNT